MDDDSKKTVLETMEMKMTADCLLDRMLCRLPDRGETVCAVQQLTHFIVSDATVTKIVSNFLDKIKKDPTFLSRCSSFHKRILMFIVVQCTLVGQDISFVCTEENLAPLENSLIRLSDIAVAFENEIDHETFYEIWMQTVKQAVLIFLKYKQTVAASKILVVYRERIMKDQREILEKFVQMCSKKDGVIKEIMGSEGHDYASYWNFVCNFLRDLNSRLERTTIHKLVEQIHISLPNNTKTSEDGAVESSISSSSVEEQDKQSSKEETEDVVPRPDATENNVHNWPQRGSPVALETATSGLEENTTSEATPDSGSDISSASRLAEKQRNLGRSLDEVLGPPRKQNEVIERTAAADDPNSDDAGPPENVKSNKEPIKIIPINPKNTLAYRLRKQSKWSSGIIIPCQHIVSHCRKVNKEGENAGAGEFPFLGKHMTSTPFKMRSLSNTYKSPVRPRELLLGDRFEQAKNTRHTTNDRSYANQHAKKFSFDVELDSFITAGCQHFGVGHWRLILQAFPFPPWCTNMKIKDRFRTLLKWQYVAVLDDGDLSVLNEQIKARLAAAHQKNKKRNADRNSGHTGTDRYTKVAVPTPSKFRGGSPTKDSRQENKTPSSTKNTTKRNRSEAECEPLTVVSMTSSQSEELTTRKVTKGRKFTLKQDGCIVCGVRYLGFNWVRIKQNFNFATDVSVSHIKERWRDLVKRRKVTMDDEEGEIRCRDSDLEEQSHAAEKDLKKKIQAQRRSFPIATDSRLQQHDSESDSAVSDTPGPSGISRKNCDMPDEDLPDIPIEEPASRRSGVKKIRKVGKQKNNGSPQHGKERDREKSDGSPATQDTNNYALKITRRRHKHTLLDSEDEPEPGPSKTVPANNRLNVSMCSDAGTQTKKRKLLLGGPSPGILEAVSDSEGRPEKILEVGSPIRPSRINFFKPSVVTENDGGGDAKLKKSKLTPAKQELRSRRQRELLRKQRRKVTVVRQAWSDAEKKELLAGLAKHGPGKWSEILDDGWEIFQDRTSVMIKDKFRNMSKNNQIPQELVLLCKAKKAAME